MDTNSINALSWRVTAHHLRTYNASGELEWGHGKRDLSAKPRPPELQDAKKEPRPILGRVIRRIEAGSKDVRFWFAAIELAHDELVSSNYERPNGKSKKSVPTKITSWSIRGDCVTESG